MVPRAVVVVVLVAVAPSVAAADTDDSEDYWFLSMGGSFAYTFHGIADNGGSLGLEISLGRAWWTEEEVDERRPFNFDIDPYWAGVYVDILRDTSLEQTRISIGPEFGKHFIGIDAGLLVQTGDDNRFGLSIRPALTIGFASLTLRYGWYWDEQPDDTLWELGLLLKFPVPL